MGRTLTTDQIVALTTAQIQALTTTNVAALTTTQIAALEIALKNIGGRAIVNSVNLEDGIERFDHVCLVARRFGAALVCLTIDERGMAKTLEHKLEVAQRMFARAVEVHGFHPGDLVFDMLTFTLGSGDELAHRVADGEGFVASNEVAGEADEKGEGGVELACARRAAKPTSW